MFGIGNERAVSLEMQFASSNNNCPFTANYLTKSTVANKLFCLLWEHVQEVKGQRRTTQGKVIRCTKDIHQHREESSRARGMLASRAKSESFAWEGGSSRVTGYKEEEKDREK